MVISVCILLRSLPAFAAVYFSALRHFFIASCLLIISVILDFFVGVIKKKIRNQNREFQLHLEGLVDSLSFGVSPGIFVFLQEPNPALFTAVFIFCAGAMFRIARFNCEGLINGCYRGLPVTYNGYIIPAVYFLIRFSGFPKPSVFYIYILLIVTLLMTSSKIRIREIG